MEPTGDAQAEAPTASTETADRLAWLKEHCVFCQKPMPEKPAFLVIMLGVKGAGNPIAAYHESCGLQALGLNQMFNDKIDRAIAAAEAAMKVEPPEDIKPPLRELAEAIDDLKVDLVAIAKLRAAQAALDELPTTALEPDDAPTLEVPT